VTQTKGDGESHPLLSPDDVFADFETWPPPAGSNSLSQAARKAEDSARGKGQGNAKVKMPTKKSTSIAATNAAPTERHSYARAALKLGLNQQQKLGANPFKFGMIGSTDSHTGLAAADDDLFWLKESSQYRARDQWYYSGSGYAAVWATENTRDSLFAAMKRKETYATTGPRMVVRFFGGWGFQLDDVERIDIEHAAYSKGVPMGGDLARGPEGGSPRFLVRAVKDPEGANLDRIQVVKGWRDIKGELHEKVFDVALSDDRNVDENGEVRPVGNTVNVAEASYANTIGDVELATVWEDPDFDENQLAFYYARVLQIPTLRWTAYDAKRFELKDFPEQIPTAIQERAYTSPIWYTP